MIGQVIGPVIGGVIGNVAHRIPILVFALVAILSCDVAALEIRIRAEAVLDVEVTAAGTVAQVSGTLRDDLGRGLPQRGVLVQIDARQTGQTLMTEMVHSDSRGRFSVHEELPPGDYEVFVRFDKTEHLDAIAHSESLRLEPRPVDVQAYGPQFVYGRDYPALVSARATSGGVPYQGWAQFLLGDEERGSVELDSTGRGTFDVAPHLTPGVNRVTVRTPGSAYRDESTATIEVRYASSVEVTAQIAERLERLQRGLAVSGVVTDGLGPVEGVRVQAKIESVVLFDAQQKPRTFEVAATTDDDGRFVAFVPSTKLSDGKWGGSAEFVPPIGSRVTVDAGTAEVDTRAYRWAVNGFGITAILFGLFVLLARVGQVFLERLRDLRRKRERARREKQALEDVEEIVPVYLDQEQVDTAVPASRSDVGAVVWDVWQKRPVPEASITLSSDSNEARTERAGADGTCRFRDLPRGRWRLEVTQYGYIRGQMEFEVPHDGRLSHFRLDLVAVPLKIRRLYSAIVEQTVGENLWGRLSPREIEERLESRWPESDGGDRARLRSAVLTRLREFDEGEHGLPSVLAALTEALEESYYSGRVYGEEAFRFARALAIDVRAATTEEEV